MNIKDVILELLSNADIVKLINEEVEILKAILGCNRDSDEQLIQSLRDEYEIEHLCVTQGKGGAVAYGPESTNRFNPNDLPEVSTVGARDSFSAVLVHG